MRPLVAAAVLFAIPRAAGACSIAVPGDFDLDLTVPDFEAPGEIGSPVTYDVVRGIGPACTEDGWSATSCDDLGILTISFPAAVDAEAPDWDGCEIQPGVGYLLRAVSGSLPYGFEFDEDPTDAFYDGASATVRLVWIDDAEQIQEPFAFTLGVRAVDLAGNEGDESTWPISDTGRDGLEDDDCEDAKDAGCAAAAVGPAWVGLVAAAGIARRRRR